MIEYRKAQLNELEELKALLWKYGPNEWNYLTQEGVDSEFNLVKQGHAEVIVATVERELVGLAVLIDGSVSPDYLQKYCTMDSMLFIGDVVVSSLHSGKGIATNLLKYCLEVAKNKGAVTVLIERHEENLGSAGMMRKAGFTILDTFLDAEKRSAGSQKTSILEFKLA